MPHRKASLAVLLLAPMAVSCSFSFSAGGGGLDYEKLQNTIADKLNDAYKPLGRQVSGVDCPRQSSKPKIDDTFVCKAKLEDQDVRIQVTVKDDSGNVDFRTLDKVFDLPDLANLLDGEITKQQGFEVEVDCGTGMKVVEIGQTLDCQAADPQGETRTVQVTVGAVDKEDRWEVLDEP